MSRRTILKGALGTGLLISAGQALPGLTGDVLGAVPKKWDRIYDVVVVGGGGAGLAAVVSAQEAGAKAILIEKAPTFNASSTAISGGLFSAANSNAHKKAGVDYPAEKFYKDLLTWGDQNNITELAKTYADNSGAVIDWLVGLGMKNLKIEPRGSTPIRQPGRPCRPHGPDHEGEEDPRDDGNAPDKADHQ